MNAVRRKRITDWLARGKPKWRHRVYSANESYHYLCVSGEQAILLDHVAATVSYDENYKGWTAIFDDGSLGVMHNDGEHLALFDSAEEAKAAAMKELPNEIEKRLIDMAVLAVNEIHDEIGFWSDILLPCHGSRTRAVRWLVDQYLSK